MNIIELGKSLDSNEEFFPKNYFQLSENIENIGNDLSHFEIIKLIGKGAFGKVYKVKSKINKQIYAMKIFDKNIKRIKKNLDIKINHPCIIKIYTHFEKNEKLYVIMEYLNNGNLKDFINMNKSNKINNILEENEILCILLQTQWALYTFHEQGFILRNIKPENILIDENMKIKFGEFLSTITEYKEGQEEKEEHPYDLEFEDESIKHIRNRTKKYMSKKLKGFQSDVFSLGLILKELTSNDTLNNNIIRIINEMCEENKAIKDTLKNIFKNITNIYSKQQKNSSIDAIVLCLKSFKNLSDLIRNNRIYENKVIDKFKQALDLINDKNANFRYWNFYINELRHAFNLEIRKLDEIEEVEPNDAYLYLMNIIINEAKNNYLRENKNNICGLNLIDDEGDKNKIDDYIYIKYIIESNNINDCPMIQNISGLMRIKRTCKNCHLTTYKFNNYILLEINPNKLLTNGNPEEKIDIEHLLHDPYKSYKDDIQCNQCFEKTEHDCSKEIYSLPDSLVISIKENFLEENYDINIKDIIELDLDKTKENKKKRFELVALLKVSRKKDNVLYYSFSKFNGEWFLSQRYKGIELVQMNDWHRRSKNVKMVFYQAIN